MLFGMFVQSQCRRCADGATSEHGLGSGGDLSYVEPWPSTAIPSGTLRPWR